MSRTVVAYAVIGCEITAKVNKTERVRCCEHPLTDTPYCAQCGRRMQIDRALHIEDWIHEQSIGPKLALDGLYWCTTRDQRLFVGILSKANEDLPAGLAEPAALRINPGALIQTARRVLIAHDLYDEATFGLWSVLYYS